jgi:hypothetical protein
MCKNRKVTEDDTKEVLKVFQPLYERLIVRFTVESNFLGAGPVVQTPMAHYQEVLCANPDWELRLATQKQAEDDRLKSSRGDDQRERWVPGTKSDPYASNINALAASSAKLAKIGQQLKKYKPQVDVDKLPCRMICSSYFFVGTYVIYLVST